MVRSEKDAFAVIHLEFGLVLGFDAPDSGAADQQLKGNPRRSSVYSHTYHPKTLKIKAGASFHTNDYPLVGVEHARPFPRLAVISKH